MMHDAGFQFLHIETYARASPGKALQRRWTFREIVAELERDEGSYPHVGAPVAPTLVYGASPSEIERTVCGIAEAMRDPTGRRLRRDTPLAIAGVASYPTPLIEMNTGEWADYLAWESDTIAWLRQRFRGRLVSVIRHTDEKFAHIHFLITPDFEMGERVDDLHPGRAAMRAAKADGASKRQQDQHYRRAMREIQDEYYSAVSIKHGLARRGPGRRRLTRNDWRAEQTQALAVAAKLHEADRNIAQTLKEAEVLKERARLAERAVADLKQKIASLRAEASNFVAWLGTGSISRTPGERPEWLPAATWSRILERLASRLSVRQPAPSHPKTSSRSHDIER